MSNEILQILYKIRILDNLHLNKSKFFFIFFLKTFHSCISKKKLTEQSTLFRGIQ